MSAAPRIVIMHDRYIMPSDSLVIATIAKPHGIRGAVRILTRAEHVPFLRTLPDVHVGDMSTKIVSVAGTDERPIVTFEAITDRTAAEQIRGRELSVARDLLPAPEVEEDEYFRADLEGCIAFAAEDDRQFGTVIRVDILPANDVLVVRTGSGAKSDVLVPFIRDAVLEVDVINKRVVIATTFLGLDDPSE